MPTEPSSEKRGVSDLLTEALYNELRALAASRLRKVWRANHTLQPTEIVDEACLRIMSSKIPVQSRSHLKALAATQMRWILVSYERHRQKGIDGMMVRTTIPDLPDQKAKAAFDLIELNEGLERLAALSERQARVIELRYFGGLTIAEVAVELGLSERTIDNDSNLACGWLLHYLSPKRDGR
jgi:RNA polymerase sigma-70 factor, ECF subfamily